MNTKKLVQSSLLVTLALALSYAERMLGIGLIIAVPGVKLGLANIVTIISLYKFDYKTTITIVSVRCILGAMFGGGFTSLMFSLCGGIIATIAMLIFKRLSLLSVYGVSVIGSAFHAIGQVVVGIFILNTLSLVYYLPVLLICSVPTGIITAFISKRVYTALR